MSEHASPASEPTSMDAFLKGLWKENPVFVMLLGMCPVLAVTNSVVNGIAMGLASAFVLVMSSMIVSLVRKLIPNEIRIAAFILIIATFVTVVDYLIQAISLDIYKALGAFIALIVVNCNILGRAEAFASKNPVGLSIADAAGVGFGFTIACLALGSVREVLGNGTFAGIRVLGPSFEPWTIMALPGGAFFVLGGWLLLFAWMRERKAARA
ncbi:MAG TPA: electron transport complex subunit E [Candidatus Krumholzibacteria bacterium]|nr:electron transport complex subunit E [Candidatus Krumholzibacteria bacterium]